MLSIVWIVSIDGLVDIMLAGAQKIIDLYNNNEFKIFIVEGDHGYGKTAYANRLIAEVYHKVMPDGQLKPNWDVNLFKKHLGFHPKHVLDLWMNKRKRDYVFHWDDAGLWLNALDYQDPFVKEVGKYLQVARSDWGCIIFSCIDRDDIVNKVRSLRHAIVIDISKQGSSRIQPNIRTATAITNWKSRDAKKTGFNYVWEERYNCMMPDPFYNWYQPLRNKYSIMAKELIKDKLEKKKDIMKYSIDV